MPLVRGEPGPCAALSTSEKAHQAVRRSKNKKQPSQPKSIKFMCCYRTSQNTVELERTSDASCVKRGAHLRSRSNEAFVFSRDASFALNPRVAIYLGTKASDIYIVYTPSLFHIQTISLFSHCNAILTNFTTTFPTALSIFSTLSISRAHSSKGIPVN